MTRKNNKEARPLKDRNAPQFHKRSKIGPGYVLASALFLTLTLGPFLWAFFISITPEYEMFTNTTNFLPKEPVLSNYTELLLGESQYSQRLFSGLFNSLKAVLVTLLCGIPIATGGGLGIFVLTLTFSATYHSAYAFMGAGGFSGFLNSTAFNGG